MNAAAARKRFPRGLAQPEDGYRFSLDSLLLAAWADPGAGAHVADLGCGCGVVGLGLLLANPEKTLHITGIEQDSAMACCAGENADRLHFSGQIDVVNNDVLSYVQQHAGAYDLCVSNPPYRKWRSGRRPTEPGRRAARFETLQGDDGCRSNDSPEPETNGEPASAPPPGDLPRFLAAAAGLLRTRGRLALVHLPERLADIACHCREYGMEPKRLRLVHSRAEEPARILLLEAVRGGRPGLTVEPPLVLYEGSGQDTRMTARALAFCPWLACNA